jgi:hypothetical protein
VKVGDAILDLIWVCGQLYCSEKVGHDFKEQRQGGEYEVKYLGDCWVRLQGNHSSPNMRSSCRRGIAVTIGLSTKTSKDLKRLFHLRHYLTRIEE